MLFPTLMKQHVKALENRREEERVCDRMLGMNSPESKELVERQIKKLKEALSPSGIKKDRKELAKEIGIAESTVWTRLNRMKRMGIVDTRAGKRGQGYAVWFLKEGKEKGKEI